MATQVKSSKSKLIDETGFNVTSVIGRVTFGGNLDQDPHVAAFKVIGAYGEPGTFEFPLPDLGTCRVTVDHIEAPGVGDPR